jgi:TRAP-type C4-dicarboxylate transport system substrate-binding protein
MIMAQYTEARKKAQDAARKAMEEHREEREKLTAEAYERMEKSQPTPTQEENDLAKLGIPIEKLQDDGSGQTVITTTTVANEPLGPYGYPAKRREKRE